MVVLVGCNNGDDPIKNKGARVATRLYVDFSDTQEQINSVVNGWIWQKFELIQAFMAVLVTCKNEEDSNKNESVRVTFLQL